MALIQTSLIWVAYAIAIAILLIIASIFVILYQHPRERAASVTVVCIFTVLALLATVLLLPVDVALVSSTVSSKEGRRNDWATQDTVDNIVYTLKIVYYALYSLDAVLCLLVVPFTYFWYEEYDETATEEGSQTFLTRLWGALKYTIFFILLCVILFLVGFFMPIGAGVIGRKGKHMDLDYFKRLLSENRKCARFAKPHGPALINKNRRRAGSHLRSWAPDHPRHAHLHHIHSFRSGSAAGSAHRISAVHLGSITRRKHRFRARAKSRTTAPARTKE